MAYNCTGCQIRDDIILAERENILFYEELVKTLQVEIDFLRKNQKLQVLIITT